MHFKNKSHNTNEESNIDIGQYVLKCKSVFLNEGIRKLSSSMQKILLPP